MGRIDERPIYYTDSLENYLVKIKNSCTTIKYFFTTCYKMGRGHIAPGTVPGDLNISAWVGDTFQVEWGALVPFSCINSTSPTKEQL